MPKQQASRIFIKYNESSNAKAPVLKGFISLTTEDLAYLNEVEADSYGAKKMQVSIWATPEEEGKYSGTLEKPYSKT